MAEDYLWVHLKELPYFRSILRAAEAKWYEGIELPAPVLDVGCGDGHFASVIQTERSFVGLDPDLRVLREAQRRDIYAALIAADGVSMPYRDGVFASGFSNSVLEHLPQLERVLHEIGRVLAPGAPFVFTVPNPGYRTELSLPQFLHRLGLPSWGEAYASWFMRMSRTWNLLDEGQWEERLAAAHLHVERTFRYFSPRALHALEWGHYFGAPCLLPRAISGRWILAPSRWNLWLTERVVRRYYEDLPTSLGTYSFFLTRRQ